MEYKELEEFSESILKGAASSQNLRKLELWMDKKYKEYAPKQEMIDNVRKVNNKLRLIVHLGKWMSFIICLYM